MAKFTPLTVANLRNESSGVARINSNFSTLSTRIENTISRDGTEPNSMGADLDMNSNRILNLPEPVLPTEPVRVLELQNAVLDANGILTGTFLLSTNNLSDLISTSIARTNLGLAIGTDVQAFNSKTVIGPTSTTDNRLTRFNGTSGASIQSTGITVSDTDDLSGVGIVSALSFIPTDASVPATNGMYLPAVNTLGWAINNAAEMKLTATALSPATSDGNALGTSALQWADLFLAEGGVINWDDGDVSITQTGNTLAFAGASTSYTFDALVDISSAAAGQIKFPATQNASSNANTLDDYEEGTWTPTILGSSTAGTGQTYTTQVGSYEKVGRQVIARFFLSVSGLGTAAGNTLIGGLPFANTATANDNGIVYITNYVVTGLAASNYGMGGVIVPSASQITVIQNGNTATSNVTIAQAGATATFNGVAIYHV